MFDGLETKTKIDEVDILPEVEEFPLKEKLAYEKQLLGFFLSDNPVKEIIRRADAHRTHRINQLDEHQHLGQTVKLAGIISRIRQVFTKKDNSPMAFLTLEDDTAALDVVVFPKTYEQVKPLLLEDGGVLITGKIDFREDKLNLVANEFEAIEELPALAGYNQPLGGNGQRTHEIVIPRGTPLEKLKQVNDLLKTHPGKDQVFILIPNGGAPKRLPVPYPVAFTEVEAGVAKLLKT